MAELKLTMGEVNCILTALGKLPWEDVDYLIDKIKEQVAECG